MGKFFYQMLADTVGRQLPDGKIDVDEAAGVFELQGGSWYRLAHGNPADVARFKKALVQSLRYQSRNEDPAR